MDRWALGRFLRRLDLVVCDEGDTCYPHLLSCKNVVVVVVVQRA